MSHALLLRPAALVMAAVLSGTALATTAATPDRPDHGCRCAGKGYRSTEDTRPDTAALSRRIEALLRDRRMTVGVAADCGRFSYKRRGDDAFPMMSVFKVHVAMAVLDRLHRLGQSPDEVLHVTADRLLPDTYSPLRDRHPQADVDITLDELIRYAVAESDNNACDVLIGELGGVDSLSAYAARLAIPGIKITETEATMHADLRRCYNNHSTPRAMNALLRRVWEGDARFGPLRRAMLATVTGPDKIAAGLPEGATLLHKTGSSDRIGGVKTGDNDAAIILLPGTIAPCFLTVFIKDSHESDAVNAATIAAITREVMAALRGE